MKRELRFDGRVGLVTGAGRGIGREYALLLAARGAAVVVNDVGGEVDGSDSAREPADGVTREIAALGGTALADHTTIASESGARSVVAKAIERFGRLDVVINNAGIAIAKPFTALAIADFQRLLDVHYFGTLHVCRAAWPHMARAGYGRIVNTVSAAMLGLPSFSGYGAAKGAVFALTRALAAEGAEHGIRANAVAPGAFTRMVAATATSVPKETVERMAATMPPRLVAPVGIFLAHESCSLTGEVLTAAGGRVARAFLAESVGYASSELTPEEFADNLARVMDPTASRPWSLDVSGSGSA